jgi:hypothetical protein
MKLSIWVTASFAVLTLLLSVACSDDEKPLDPEENLCAGESGVGARLTGRAAPVDICVPDNVVVTSFTEQNRYDVTARVTGSDRTVFEIQMRFPHKTNFPSQLNLTGNFSHAEGDPDGVWFSYKEFPPEGDAVESSAVTGGTFTLSFSDTEVAAGTFQGIVLDIQIEGTNDPAGSRTIPEGFFSISTDS